MPFSHEQTSLYPGRARCPRSTGCAEEETPVVVAARVSSRMKGSKELSYGGRARKSRQLACSLRVALLSVQREGGTVDWTLRGGRSETLQSGSLESKQRQRENVSEGRGRERSCGAGASAWGVSELEGRKGGRRADPRRAERPMRPRARVQTALSDAGERATGGGTNFFVRRARCCGYPSSMASPSLSLALSPSLCHSSIWLAALWTRPPPAWRHRSLWTPADHRSRGRFIAMG